MLKLAFLLLFFNTAATQLAADEFKVPPLSRPVTDQASRLQPDTVATLERLLSDVRNSGGSQIAILILPTLGGQTIEQASIKVVDTWQLGRKGEDKGTLVLLALQERKVRIEVGRGLEGDIPDAYAKRIIDEVMIPYFKQNNYDAGLLAGIGAILQRSDPQFDLNRYQNEIPLQKPRRQAGRQTDLSFSWFMVIFVIFVIFQILRGLLGFTGAANRLGRGSSWGGGSGWGGGRSGGGFSGGGGGFSGGGASGGW